jgi:hypothetical protein
MEPDLAVMPPLTGKIEKKGAMISYVINKKVNKEVEKENKPGTKELKKDSLILKIYNSSGEQIRTLTNKVPENNGLNRLYWNLDEKGVFRPSRKDNKSKTEPSGADVIPGTYKLLMLYQGAKDSASIEVAYDPRIPISEDVLAKQHDVLKQLELKMDLCYRSVERLKASKTIVNNIKSRASKIDKESYKDLIKSSDSISKRIDGLIDEMLGKEDKRQGITASKDPTALSYLNKAMYYVGSLQSEPGSTEMRLIKNANSKLDPIIEEINNFYQIEWLNYRSLVENVKLSMFKDYETLK